MIEHVYIVSSGLLLYLVLCVISCLAGYGLLRLLGLATASPAMVLLTPGIALVFWAIVIGITVGLRVSMKDVTPWLAGATAVLALNAMRRPWPALRYESALLPLCAALPAVVMARYFWYGISDYTGSITPDGWSYVAYGQYLWEYPRGSDGGLAPLYQYASHLSSSRYISSGLLGFFSPLISAGDTQAVSSLFQAWTIFCMACAVAFFWATETTKLWMIVTATVLSTVTGWIANLVWANNFDNSLALIYLPAAAGIINIIVARNWRWWILLGAMLAALLHAYPELAPLIAASVALLALPKIWRERASWRMWLGGSVLALAVAFVLVLPVFDLLIAFFLAQIASATSAASRPGDALFLGLLVPKFILAAIWGLGGEHQITEFSQMRNLLGLALTLIAALGLIALLRQRKWGIVGSIVFLVIGAAYFLIRRHYAYGAYKLLVIDWWGIVAALVTGVDWALERLRRVTLRRGVIAGCALLLLLTLSQSNHTTLSTTEQYISSPNQQLGVEQFRQLDAIKKITGQTAVTVLVNDWIANEWAVYYLRDIPINLIEKRMYMAQAHVLPFLQRAQVIAPGQARYVLTDKKFYSSIGKAQRWQLIWSGGPYQLWQPESAAWATITDIKNANGLEQSDGEPFFWVGRGSTAIHVLAAHTGILQLSANMVIGPSLPGRPDRRVQIAANGVLSQTLTLADGQQQLRVPVIAGDNTITLLALDKPEHITTNGNDSRPRLLGIKGLAVSLQPESAHTAEQLTLQGVENPNGLERVDGQAFFWLGQGTTVLHLTSDRPGFAQISAELVLGPSLPGSKQRRLQISTDHGYQAQTTVADGAYTFTVPVAAGATDVQIKTLDTPSLATTGQGDPRPLLLGVKGLQVWFQEQ